MSASIFIILLLLSFPIYCYCQATSDSSSILPVLRIPFDGVEPTVNFAGSYTLHERRKGDVIQRSLVVSFGVDFAPLMPVPLSGTFHRLIVGIGIVVNSTVRFSAFYGRRRNEICQTSFTAPDLQSSVLFRSWDASALPGDYSLVVPDGPQASFRAKGTMAWLPSATPQFNRGDVINVLLRVAVQRNAPEENPAFDKPITMNCSAPDAVLSAFGAVSDESIVYLNKQTTFALVDGAVSTQVSPDCFSGVPSLTLNGACRTCFPSIAGGRCSISCSCSSPTGVCSEGPLGNGSCLSCSSNRFGPTCASECQCNSLNSLGCDTGIKGSGACRCRSNYGGVSCNDCGARFFGRDCQQPCSCDNGVCNAGISGNGECSTCALGYAGRFCNTTCPSECPAGMLCMNDVRGGLCVQPPSQTTVPSVSASSTSAVNQTVYQARRMSVTFEASIEQFDANRFIRVVALAVNVDESNVKVVAVKPGSVIVDFRIIGMSSVDTERTYSTLVSLIQQRDPSLNDLPPILYYSRPLDIAVETPPSIQLSSTSDVASLETSSSLSQKPVTMRPGSSPLPPAPGLPLAPGSPSASAAPSASVIVGIVVGTVVGFAALMILIICCCRSTRKIPPSLAEDEVIHRAVTIDEQPSIKEPSEHDGDDPQVSPLKNGGIKPRQFAPVLSKEEALHVKIMENRLALLGDEETSFPARGSMNCGRGATAPPIHPAERVRDAGQLSEAAPVSELEPCSKTVAVRRKRTDEAQAAVVEPVSALNEADAVSAAATELGGSGGQRHKKPKRCKFCGGIFGETDEVCPVEKRSHAVLKQERKAEKREKRERKRRVTTQDDTGRDSD